MLIGICDDEQIIKKELIRLCDEYNQTNLSAFKLVSFSSGEEILQFGQTIDILFLDIQMKGMDGLKTAEKIRENDEGMIIIFLTGYKGYMQVGYRVRAFRYLLKPVNEQDFYNTLTEAIKEITRNSKAIVNLEGETLFIKLNDIIYIEYMERHTLVRTCRGSYESQQTMSEWEDILNNGDFFRVHKAYIVNIGFIEEIGKQVLLDNGEKVELAIRQIGKLKKACKAYRRRNAR